VPHVTNADFTYDVNNISPAKASYNQNDVVSLSVSAKDTSQVIVGTIIILIKVNIHIAVTNITNLNHTDEYMQNWNPTSIRTYNVIAPVNVVTLSQITQIELRECFGIIKTEIMIDLVPIINSAYPVTVNTSDIDLTPDISGTYSTYDFTNG
jgi:hypothetical protein